MSRRDRTIVFGRSFGQRRDWTAPAASIPDLYGVEQYVAKAQESEAAVIDFLFRADTFFFDRESTLRSPAAEADSFVVAASVAATTHSLGLVSTRSTTFNYPYSLARDFLTLDHLTHGRAGWNAVTSFTAEEKFGLRGLPDQTERYARAAEFVEIVHRLWTSWEPEAVVFDQVRRVFADPARIREVVYDGEYLSVHGALGLPPSPQGRPVQFQAGASESGLAFAGRFAEAVFSASLTIDHAVSVARALKAQARAHGRAPSSLLVLPGFRITSAATTVEVDELIEATRRGLDYERGRALIEFTFDGRLDIADLDLDEQIPQERFPDLTTLRRHSRTAIFRDIASREGATLRDVIDAMLLSAGHYATAGTYDEIVHELIDWFDRGAADGFVVSFGADEASQFAAFRDEILPRLRDRGYAKRDYHGDTLRDNLRLPVPASPW